MSVAPGTVWLAVAVLSVGTFALRASFLLGVDYLGDLPQSVQRVLPFVPPAVLAALVAPNLLVVDGGLALGPGNPRLLAGLVGVAVARYSGSMLATVGAGMAALWLLQWL